MHADQFVEGVHDHAEVAVEDVQAADIVTNSDSAQVADRQGSAVRCMLDDSQTPAVQVPHQSLA